MSNPYQPAGAGNLYQAKEVLPPAIAAPAVGSEEYLRYLFVAEFADGTQIAQTPQDASALGSGKSAFYDVLEKTKESPVVRFHLTDGTNWYTVDLTDGMFEVNGFPFSTVPQFFLPSPPLTLIYFTETRGELSTYPDGSTVQRQYVNRYFIGWWCLDSAGKKVEQTIAIA